MEALETIRTPVETFDNDEEDEVFFGKQISERERKQMERVLHKIQRNHRRTLLFSVQLDTEAGDDETVNTDASEEESKIQTQAEERKTPKSVEDKTEEFQRIKNATTTVPEEPNQRRERVEEQIQLLFSSTTTVQ